MYSPLHQQQGWHRFILMLGNAALSMRLHLHVLIRALGLEPFRYFHFGNCQVPLERGRSRPSFVLEGIMDVPHKVIYSMWTMRYRA
eukprot:scaffold3526_cov115-Cylindrotheca_fusiformis.AAC.2